MAPRVLVVTVPAARRRADVVGLRRRALHPAVPVVVGLLAGDRALAVIVEAVAQLVGSRRDQGVPVVAVHGGAVGRQAAGVRLGEGPIAVQVEVLVHERVAVIVGAVAGLDGGRTHRRVEVVAVGVGGPVVGDAVGLESVERAVAVQVEDLVDRAVAVLIEPIADLARPRVDRRVGLVAVQLRPDDSAVADRRVVEPVLVGVEVLVDEPVTVVVDPIAGLGRAWVHGVVIVVAVPVAGAVGVAVDVLVHVGHAVAVVVDAVAADFGRGRVHQVVVVVAVAAAGGPAVVVLIEAVVDDPVAVLIDSVAVLDGSGLDLGVAVVAVGQPAVGRRADHVQPVEEAVAVQVERLVDVAVAVVVLAVAHLRRSGVAGVIAVVAVVASDGGSHVARLRDRALHPAVAVAVGLVRRNSAVAVPVPPVAQLGGAGVDLRHEVVAVRHRPGQHAVSDVAVEPAIAVAVEVLVDLPIAVVVVLVAGLRRTGEDRRVAVVAVVPSGAGQVLVPVTVRVEVLVDVGVAVLVDPVTDLRGARVDGGVAVVAVGQGAVRERAVSLVTVVEAVDIRVEVLVDVSVAVLIDAVAHLAQPRGSPGVPVVAVAGTLADAVAVAVRLVARQHPVAVAVQAIADLERPREDRCLDVVTVPVVTLVEAVPVVVGLVRGHRAVAVAVDAVAQLGRPREDREEAVVAVALAR